MKRREELVRRREGDLSGVRPDATTGSAFSLIELLCVMAILMILTTLYWGSGSGDRQRAQKAACQKNLLNIYVAMQIYANEHTAQFPVVNSARNSEEALDVLVPRYISDTAPFICPGNSAAPLPPGDSIRKHKISYAYYMGRRLTNAPQALLSDAQIDTNPKTTGQQVFSSTGKAPGNNHGKSGGNFLFTDGHAEDSPAQAAFALNLGVNEVLLNP
jgi:prepilin-type N-terminal cleavage/methylation domain-containing protein/prepilin-type processing-associated H-X9-DG protein